MDYPIGDPGPDGLGLFSRCAIPQIVLGGLWRGSGSRARNPKWRRHLQGRPRPSGPSSEGSAGGGDSVSISISAVSVSDSFVGEEGKSRGEEASAGSVGSPVGVDISAKAAGGRPSHVGDMTSGVMSTVMSLEKFGVAGGGIDRGGLGVLWAILFLPLRCGWMGFTRAMVGLVGFDGVGVPSLSDSGSGRGLLRLAAGVSPLWASSLFASYALFRVRRALGA